MIEEIINNNKKLAIILRRNFKDEGIKFFTPNDYSQQLGYMNRPKDYEILPHLHNSILRQVNYTNEVLFIKSGKVRVDFYDEKKSYLESRILYKDDIILLAYGGHGFKMLEPTEMIEVKQGPYMGEADKTHFESIIEDKVKLKD